MRKQVYKFEYDFVFTLPNEKKHDCFGELNLHHIGKMDIPRYEAVPGVLQAAHTKLSKGVTCRAIVTVFSDGSMEVVPLGMKQ